jgi:hypothetical protein
MKRNLIILAIATLGLAGNAAFAEPSLELQGSQDRAMVSVPETTSYQADTKRASIFGEGSELAPFNP